MSCPFLFRRHSLFFMHYFQSSAVFFFFQAEDGIRDGHVTGVQTCALPILTCALDHVTGGDLERTGHAGAAQMQEVLPVAVLRSEERRVGKECRSRWWPYY